MTQHSLQRIAFGSGLAPLGTVVSVIAAAAVAAASLLLICAYVMSFMWLTPIHNFG